MKGNYFKVKLITLPLYLLHVIKEGWLCQKVSVERAQY